MKDIADGGARVSPKYRSAEIYSDVDRLLNCHGDLFSLDELLRLAAIARGANGPGIDFDDRRFVGRLWARIFTEEDRPRAVGGRR
jgi:hypothetical protein